MSPILHKTHCYQKFLSFLKFEIEFEIRVYLGILCLIWQLYQVGTR